MAQPMGPSFPLLVGVLSLSLFAYLSACYLTLEVEDPQLQEDFRCRALFSGFVSLLTAFATYAAAGTFAQEIRDGLSRAPYVWLVEVVAAIASLVAFQGLWLRRYRRARIAAAAQVGLIVFGWGVAQFPYLVRPDLTIAASSAPINILVDIEIACAIGEVILFPSLYLLFYIFKAHRKSVVAENKIA
jgi:cytochrome d ubiquinol oxidase subunit II